MATNPLGHDNDIWALRSVRTSPRNAWTGQEVPPGYAGIAWPVMTTPETLQDTMRHAFRTQPTARASDVNVAATT